VNLVRKPITNVGLDIKRWIGGSPVSQHYRDGIKASFSLMSHGIAAHTRLAGAALGNFLDDLTNRMSFPTSSLVLPF